LCWIIKRSDGFIFLDYVNLAFHEAGHPFFGLFGETLGLYGGTIGQLVFPVVSLIAFLRRGDTVGVSVAGVWLFENFFNIARYMADARVQQLPLVGGGEHDWWHIFTRWGVLDSDTKIAHAVSGMGWIGLIGVWWWLAWHFFRTMQDVQNGPSARPQVKEAPEV
jgi:hypothetical protein